MAIEALIQIKGIRIEVHTDGAVEIYASSDEYQILTRQGRGQNPATGRLMSCAVIAPLLVQHPIPPGDPAPGTPSALTVLDLKSR